MLLFLVLFFYLIHGYAGTVVAGKFLVLCALCEGKGVLLQTFAAAKPVGKPPVVAADRKVK